MPSPAYPLAPWVLLAEARDPRDWLENFWIHNPVLHLGNIKATRALPLLRLAARGVATATAVEYLWRVRFRGAFSGTYHTLAAIIAAICCLFDPRRRGRQDPAHLVNDLFPNKKKRRAFSRVKINGNDLKCPLMLL